MILRRVEGAGRGIGEPAVADAARRAGEAGEITGERDAQPALTESLAEFGADLGGGVVEAVEDPQQSGGDVLLARFAATRRGVPGEVIEMFALLVAEVQTLRDRGDHLLRGVRAVESTRIRAARSQAVSQLLALRSSDVRAGVSEMIAVDRAAAQAAGAR